VPACDPEKPWFSVDLRTKDVSALDLRQRARDLDCAVFDSHTLWPPADRLPQGFAPARILAQSRNPGLGLRAVHAKGVTGRGVGIGIIDMPLLPDHQEYASRLRWYEFTQSPGHGGAGLPPPHMHGSAVASIAVGRTVGVAPEADLYFIATPSESPMTAVLMPHFFAQAIRRLVEINRALPADRKIRAISLIHDRGDHGTHPRHGLQVDDPLLQGGLGPRAFCHGRCLPSAPAVARADCAPRGEVVNQARGSSLGRAERAVRVRT
jgi:hypothetical protein